jgi:hypothetical protein
LNVCKQIFWLPSLEKVQADPITELLWHVKNIQYIWPFNIHAATSCLPVAVSFKLQWMKLLVTHKIHYIICNKKGKVVPVLNQLSTVPWRYMGEWKGSSTILDLSICHSHFTPEGRAPSIHWIGAWVGPRSSMDAMGKRKILPLPGIEPWSFSP